ncbi:hypothetical protein JOF28_001326 [Leucobacter exalbidus]|uniref:Peptidoglycan binding domain-containing protein n=1 Tax=Leucobacter exalbidus TaxID=662960 RepID=A0A940PVK3_9MICO|nr:hypothetical protein [Leucobacter exalbidus]MBP1326094.1 hypothetical protein [Leucobacter exalbidus]
MDSQSPDELNKLLLEEDSAADDAAVNAPAAKKAKKPWQGKRLVVLVAGVAVVSLLAGVGLMQFIVSPAELAARTEPPEAGVVTAPLEVRVIKNTVVTRADVGYAGAVDVTIDSAGETSIVTGRVPKVGSVLNAKDIALEVVGRPVIVLPGALPAYRDLSIGSSGPDVTQLHTALTSLGYAAGDSDTFTSATSAAIQALYNDIGYLPPSSSNSGEEGGTGSGNGIRDAERAVQEANASLAAANSAYAAAASPQSGAAVVEAQNAVAAAQRALDAARNAKESPDTIFTLEGDLSLAQAQLAEAQAPQDLDSFQLEVNAAQSALELAQEDLATAQENAMPGLPSSEVLFLSDLPRRVDQVNVQRGKPLDSTALVVSGNTLTLTGSLTKQDAPLIKEGMEAVFSVPGGDDFTATVTKVEKATSRQSSDEGGDEGGDEERSSNGPSGPYVVTLEPNKLNKKQTSELRDANVRISFEIESTGGEVLAVPIAALTAGPDGSSRIEIAQSQNANPDDTEIIDVETGLSAQGFVEVISDDPRVAEGAKVVVGR